jgi:hypothetical protein
MSEQKVDSDSSVRDQVEAIVKNGQEIRIQVSQVVGEAIKKQPASKEGLLGLAKSVLDSAVMAVDKSVSHDPDSALRQVVDGLGDGLSTAAMACRLALEEAEAKRRSFAGEDLAKLNKDLRTLGDLFADTVSDSFQKLLTMTGQQVSALREHAVRTGRKIQPSIASALSAAGKHPIQLGKESVSAGLNVSRLALGGLFTAVGKSMEEAGNRLKADRAGASL